MHGKPIEQKVEQELETKVEQSTSAKKDKAFTDLIRENFRKLSAVYFAAAAIGIGGLAGCGPTTPYTPQYTQEYTRPVPTEFVAADGTRIYREEKVKINDPRTRLAEILRSDCDNVSNSGDLITCEDYGCVDYVPEKCYKETCLSGYCNRMGYMYRWTLPLKSISSLSVKTDTDSGEITIRKGNTGWSTPEEKVLSFKNADVCKKTADILYTFFRTN